MHPYAPVPTPDAPNIDHFLNLFPPFLESLWLWVLTCIFYFHCLAGWMHIRPSLWELLMMMMMCCCGVVVCCDDDDDDDDDGEEEEFSMQAVCTLAHLSWFMWNKTIIHVHPPPPYVHLFVKISYMLWPRLQQVMGSSSAWQCSSSWDSHKMKAPCALLCLISSRSRFILSYLIKYIALLAFLSTSTVRVTR